MTDEQGAGSDDAASATSGRRGAGIRLHGRPRRRASDEDDEGPFFPPDPEPASASMSPAPPRPRPSPASRTNAPGPAVPVRPRPRPGPATAPVPAEPQAAAADAADFRSPDINRYLADESAEKPKGSEQATEKKPRKRRTLRGSGVVRRVVKLLVTLLIAAVAALVLRAYVVAPYYIPSASMEPTLQGGGSGANDRILVDKITYRIHDPHEGDIVVFNRPDTWHINDKTLVKRIIGLPGDIVTLRKGLVYVNGMRLTETYLDKACGPAPTKPLTKTSRWTVPMGDYFVMGDNRCNSEDSRALGPIPGSKIVGRAFLRIWPLSRFGRT